jgi:Short-chain dehydrogenases of various substrate specificities
MACRSLEKAETAADDIRTSLKDVKDAGEVVIRQLDLSSLKSVRKCAQEILDNESAIHLLINNAGENVSLSLFLSIKCINSIPRYFG